MTWNEQNGQQFLQFLVSFFEERCLRNHYTKLGGELTSQNWRMAIFPQLSNSQPYCPWHHYQENPLDYNFYTYWYWLCSIDFMVISTQNHHGKRIVIPGPESNSDMLEISIHENSNRSKLNTLKCQSVWNVWVFEFLYIIGGNYNMSEFQ